MKHFTKSSLFLLLVLLIAACRKDSSIITDTPNFPTPTVLIETGARGMVADEDGNAIEGATVRLGQEVTTTNAFGYFEISGKTNAAQPFVRIEKAGYFPSICNFTGRAGEYGRLKSILRIKALSGSIQAGNGGVIQVSGGGSIEFKPGGFVNSSGQPYTGDVNVYATYLDPTKPETMQMIPGSFRGTNLEGEDQVLVSYGMMNVLLESPSGEKLQINKPATLTTPIPSERLADAPSNIPLWYINEATSIWMEEGSATKQGNSYIGEVTHFSWWNVDVEFPVVTLRGRIVIDGNYPFVLLRVTMPSGQQTLTIPDSEGYFTLEAPADVSFPFEIINECGVVMHTDILGPYNSDTELGNIVVNSGSSFSTITGTLENCAGQSVTHGVVFVTGASSSFYQFPIEVNSVDGTFLGTVPTCGSVVIVTGYDLNTLTGSNPVLMPVTANINFGEISVCATTPPEGITIEYGGQVKFIPDVSILILGPQTNGAYSISSTDIQGNSQVIYTIGLFRENVSPPDWTSFGNVEIFNNPIYFQGFETGNVNMIQAGVESGEYLHAELTGVNLLRYPGPSTFTNAKITIVVQIP